MLSLLVCLLLQQEPPSNEIIFNDLCFSQAVEDFSRSLDRTKCVPGPAGVLVDYLGVTDWRLREKWTNVLEDYCRKNPGSIRWLFWGRRNRDPEIAFRCNRILRRLFLCTVCNGSGKSRTSMFGCWGCDGERYVWRFNVFD